jgi:hypothetical protein
MILTPEFLKDNDACDEGTQVAIENNFFGLEYNAIVRSLISLGHRDFAGWMIETKATEYYVRANGSIFTMGAYQVFNPTTGIHTRYETEAEAKAALIEAVKAFLDQCGPKVLQELANEHGDTTWVPTDLIKDLNIS